MNKYMIRGGRELYGEITVSGAKNAAVAIIPAALLVDGVCRIENIPQISDVTLFFSILEELGAKVRVLNRHAIEIDMVINVGALKDRILATVDLRPMAIINRFDLRRPIYEHLSSYGHFGENAADMPWEKLDLAL